MMHVPKLMLQGLKLAASLPSLVLFAFAGQFCMVELLNLIPRVVMGEAFDPGAVQTPEQMTAFVEGFQAQLLLMQESVDWPVILKVVGILVLVFLVLTAVRTGILGIIGNIFHKGPAVRPFASFRETFPSLFPRLAVVGLAHVVVVVILGSLTVGGLRLGGAISDGGAVNVPLSIRFMAASITLIAIAGLIINELLRLSIMGHAAVFPGLSLPKVFRLGFRQVVRSLGRLMQIGISLLAMGFMIIFFSAFLLSSLMGVGEFGMALVGALMTMVQAYLIVAGWGVFAVVVRLSPGGTGILEMLDGMRQAQQQAVPGRGADEAAQSQSSFGSLPENVFRLSQVVDRDLFAPLPQAASEGSGASDDELSSGDAS